MAAKYVLTLLAVVFLGAALGRLRGGTGLSHPQTKTWLLVAAIFSVVSAWLWYQEAVLDGR